MLLASVVLQSALFLYLQASIAVNLYPWNDFEAGGDGPKRFRFVPIFAAIGLLQLAAIISTVLEVEALMVLALALYAAWLSVQLMAWWRPYLFGASERHRELHEKYFGRTYRLLPTLGDHPVPDAMHTALHVLLAAILATTAGALTAR